MSLSIGILDSNQKINGTNLILNYDVAQLRCYPTTGTTITDLSGANNTGTLTNGPVYNSLNGGNITFDGTNDYITTTTVAVTTIMTLTYWFNLISMGAILGYITNKTNGTNTANYGLFIDTSRRFGINSYNGSTSPTLVGTTILSTGTWYNLTGVYNGSSSQIYINGVLENSGTLQSVSSGSRFGIGGNFQGSANYINGRMACCYLYSRALSSTEILNNFDATKSRFGY
jgi:hypothetical protein